MRIIATRTIKTYGEKHADAAASLSQWATVMGAAKFETMQDVVAAFSKAKALNGARARFEVAGGNYRLIASFNFRRQMVFVKFIGTHAEYDRVNALTVSIF